MHTKRQDAIVVGLGAAGCWAAKCLTEQGLSVTALDAGPLLEGRDLPQQVRGTGNLRRLLTLRRFVQARSVSYHPAVRHLYVDDVDNPYRTAGGDTFLWIRGRQVGGRLHTWARMALRLSDDDFARLDPEGHGIPWPIRYADLEPYYDAVESFHGLRGARDHLPGLPDGVVSEETVLGGPAAWLRAKVEAAFPGRRVIAPRVLKGGREPVPKALAAARETGRLRLLPGAVVARLVLDRSGARATGVEYVDAATRRSAVLAADRIFLCASAIESVRILLNSAGSAHPGGVGNHAGLLGRYLLDHNFVVGTGVTGGDYRRLAAAFAPRRYHPLDLAAELDFYIPDFSGSLEERDFSRGFGIQGRVTPTHWGMGVFGAMQPHPDNRVTLADRRDACGIKAANIAVRRHAGDLRMIRAQKSELLRVARAADLVLRMPMPRWIRGLAWRLFGPEVGVMHPGAAIHEAGGARMGDDPRRSVLNPRNQLWRVPNVYVTDGACFPGTGCQNPTLTIMALTARACDLAAHE